MPSPTDTALGQRYGEYAGFTTEASPSAVDYFGDDPLHEIKRLLDLYIRPESCILDIGCGAGQTLAHYAPHVKEAWGLDASADLLAGAHERVQRQGLTNVTLVEGQVDHAHAVAHLPDDHFDIMFTESGPNITGQLVQKLTATGYFLQEVGGHYSGYQLQEILGRVPYTTYAYHQWDQSHLIHAADLGLLPVSFKHCFWEVYFRDLAHLEKYVAQDAVLSNWRLAPRPYEPERDRPALALYAQYHRTPKGIRLLYHVQILVWRRAPIHYYPVDGMA